MYGLAHANVLRFHAWYRTANHLWTVSEYCAGGDLRKLLSQDGVLPEPTVMSFGVDALAGLQCVHRHELLMVDLQPQHLLVDEHGLVKLADFGAALRVGDAAVRDAVAAAPAAHRPPEAGVGAPLSFASDFWALGSLLHELITGRRPFARAAADEEWEAVRSAPFEPLERGSAKLNSLLLGLLAKAPHERPGWDELRKYAFWGVELPAAPMPAQPHYDEWLAAHPPPKRRPPAAADDDAGAERENRGPHTQRVAEASTAQGPRSRRALAASDDDPLQSASAIEAATPVSMTPPRPACALGSLETTPGAELAAATPGSAASTRSAYDVRSSLDELLMLVGVHRGGPAARRPR